MKLCMLLVALACINALIQSGLSEKIISSSSQLRLRNTGKLAACADIKLFSICIINHKLL